MKPLFLLITLLTSLSSWAQVRTIPPVNETEMRLCEDLMVDIKKNEKSIVEMGKKKYRSEKSFFKEIDRRLVKDSVKKVSEDKLGPKIEKCSSEEITILSAILEDYKKSNHDNCPEFRQTLRWNYKNKIEQLIQINE